MNQWAGATVFAGTQVATVASNTATTLTLTVPWTATPATHSPYALSLSGVLNFNYFP